MDYMMFIKLDVENDIMPVKHYKHSYKLNDGHWMCSCGREVFPIKYQNTWP